jgi:hypothetical protein
VQLDLFNLKAFFTHCQNVTKAAENLPLIISAQSFQDANNYARAEIKKLHESLYKVEEGEYQCSDGKKRDYFTCTPLALDIADFLNDDDVANEEVKTSTEKIIKSFLGLMTALNKFIRLKNELPINGYTIEKNVIEESFTELASVLGTVIKPLGDHIKDVLEDCIYNGPVLGSLKRQMDKKFGNEPKTIRELLTLDKNTNGSIRKKPIDKKELEEKAKAEEHKRKKAQRSQAKQARKANRKK